MYANYEFTFYAIASIVLLPIKTIIQRLLKSVKNLTIGNSDSTISSIVRTTNTNLVGNIIIITGANTGIGKATALQLAKYGGTIILGCRSIEKGLEACKEINEQLLLLTKQDSDNYNSYSDSKSDSSSNSNSHCNSDSKSNSVNYPCAKHGKAIFMRLDLCDFQSVLDFSKRIHEEYNRIDIVINNAGINESAKFPNGLQQLFQVNFLSHFLLVRLLQDLLQSRNSNDKVTISSSTNSTNTSTSTIPTEARVVNLSSVTHHLGQPDFKKSSLAKYDGLMSIMYSYYSDTKLYLNMFTYELNKRYGLATIAESSNNIFQTRSSTEADLRPIVAVSANPGAVRSDIWRNFSFQELYTKIMKLLYLEVEEGAGPSTYAATVTTKELLGFHSHHLKNSKDYDAYGRMIYHPLTPYVVPYDVPPKVLRYLEYEIVGPYGGPQFGPVTYSVPPAKACAELWDYSDSVLKRLLLVGGLPAESLKFLD